MASNSDSIAMNLWNREQEITHHYFLHYLSILLIHYFACRVQLGVTRGLLTLEITIHTQIQKNPNTKLFLQVQI